MKSSLTLDEVLNTNTYIKENSAIDFRSPKEYINPFLDIVSKVSNDFRVEVSGRTANANNEIGVQEAYSRILVEAYLPQAYSLLEHDSTIGMVYALDTQKPIIKVYAGRKARACTNLAVFGARWLHEIELLKGTSSIYEMSQEYTKTLDEQLENFQKRYGRMIQNELLGSQIDLLNGTLLKECVQNKIIGTNVVLDATRSLYDTKSAYSIRNNKTTEWNIFSAYTQYFTDKADIIDIPTKTVALEKIFYKISNN